MQSDDMQIDSVDITTQLMEDMECHDSSVDGNNDEEQLDTVGEIPAELWNKIRDQKKTEPTMFVSGWEEDDQGIDAGDLSDPGQQFLSAAENGDIEKMKRLHDSNPSLLVTRDADGYTALHRAAYNGHNEACKWLLAIGADPEMRTEDGWTVLHSAACWAAHEVVGTLLSRSPPVDVNSRSNGDVTPLHLAINSTADPQNQLITIKYLLSAPGIDMSALNKAGETPIMLANRASQEVRELIQHFLYRP